MNTTQDFINAILDAGLDEHPRIAYAGRAEKLARRIATVIRNLWTIEGAELPDPEPMERLTEAYYNLRNVNQMEVGELHAEHSLAVNLRAIQRYLEFIRDDVHAAMLLLPPKPVLMDVTAELDMLIERLRRRVS